MDTPELFPIFVPQSESKTRYRVGYIDQSGKLVIDSGFNQGTLFVEGRASVQVKAGRWGVIDTNGNFCDPARPLELVLVPGWHCSEAPCRLRSQRRIASARAGPADAYVGCGRLPTVQSHLPTRDSHPQVAMT